MSEVHLYTPVNFGALVRRNGNGGAGSFPKGTRVTYSLGFGKTGVQVPNPKPSRGG